MKSFLWTLTILLVVVEMLGACTTGMASTPEQLLSTPPPGNLPFPQDENLSPFPTSPVVSGIGPSPVYDIRNIAPSSTDAGPQWTAQAIREATAEAELQATPSPEPVLTPVSQGVLLRDVWTMSTEMTRTGALIYSEVVSSKHIFWKLNLPDITQRTQILSFPTAIGDSGYPRFGLVSPNGEWIAYLRQESDMNSLYVVQTNGHHDQLVAEGLGIGGEIRGFYRLAWSPDSQRLVFRKHHIINDQEKHDVYIYKLQAGRGPELITTILRAYPIGWIDTKHILLTTIRTFEQQTPQFEIIHIETGKTKTLLDFPPEAGGGFYLLSPDNEKVLLSWGGDFPSMLEIPSRSYRKLDISTHQSLWGADNESLLEIPFTGDDRARIVNLDHPNISIYLTLMPSSLASSRFTAHNISPDGRYFVVYESCAQAIRTLLYDISNNQWHTIADPNPVVVMGWVPQK